MHEFIFCLYSESNAYDVHYWMNRDCTQDEDGKADSIRPIKVLSYMPFLLGIHFPYVESLICLSMNVKINDCENLVRG